MKSRQPNFCKTVAIAVNSKVPVPAIPQSFRSPTGDKGTTRPMSVDKLRDSGDYPCQQRGGFEGEGYRVHTKYIKIQGKPLYKATQATGFAGSANKQKGFSLLEIIIALTIISLTAVMILDFKGDQIRNLSILEEKMQAGWIADNQLALLLLAHSDQQPVPKDGRVVMGRRTWYWRAKHLPQWELLQPVDLEVSLQSDFSMLSASIRIYLTSSRSDP